MALIFGKNFLALVLKAGGFSKMKGSQIWFTSNFVLW